MNTKQLTLALFVIGLAICMATGSAWAERTAASPQVGGSVTLFGTVYSVNGIDTVATAFQGLGGLENNCGMAIGWREGATTAQDQIFLADECDSFGEDIAVLTGVDAVTYAPTATATTSSYLVDSDVGGRDPSGIEWISDVNAGSTDINYRVPIGVTFEVWAFDTDDLPGTDILTVPTTDIDVLPDGYKGIGACKNAKDDTATRMYICGVDTDAGNHFAVCAFDLTTNSFVSNHSILLDGIGTPDAAQADRAFREMAFDGTYYYAMVKKPGVAESWLYQFDSMPDPPAGGDAAHPDPTPPSSQLDTATGVAWPDLGVPGTADDRPDRAGIACGRMLTVDLVQRPVFYVLCDTWLYTLVPTTVLDVDQWPEY